MNITGPTPNSIVAFAGTPQTVEVTGVFANTLKAKVVDINNKPLSGVDVFFTAPANTDKTIASGTFSGGVDTISIITDSLGIAESTLFTADSIAGNYTVLATVNGLPPAQFLLTNACLNSSLVTNNADNGPGSLRFIIAGACPEALVTFAPGINKITLTNGQINIVRALTITGPGADRLTVSGNSNSRIFSINPINTSDSINIYGLTISDGMPPNVNDYRGGGGILMYNGNVNLTRCVISNNDASYSSAGTGGGLEDVGGSVTINNCSIVQNTASEGGAGVNAFNCAMHIYNSTIALNNAPSIYYSYGGGIYLGNISAYIENCTIYGNTAAVGGNISSYGSAYGGNYLDTLKNTIVAGGTLIPGYTTGGPDLWGTNFISLGYNLIQDNSSGLYSFVNGSSSTDLTGLSPNLLALGDYGGTTPTLLPKPNSPVINEGDVTLPPAQFDQRGFVRVAGGRADIGAVETNYAVTAFAGTPQSAAVNTQFANALQSKVTESGNPVDSVPVVFNSASATIASGIFGNGQTTDTVLTNATGTAATFITANNLTGIYKVTGSIGIPFTPANFYLTNTKALAVAFGRITAAVNNCTVQIAWQTLTNEANETFTVEHSTDGLNFSTLYTTTSKASGVGLQTYNYTHTAPAAGANYYRIKEADADGTSIYSETIMAVNTCSNAPIIAYPNPVHNTLIVVMPGSTKQAICIYDARGRLVTRYASAGGTLTIDVSKWAGGIYTLKVAKDDGSTYDLKIIKN